MTFVGVSKVNFSQTAPLGPGVVMTGQKFSPVFPREGLAFVVAQGERREAVFEPGHWGRTAAGLNGVRAIDDRDAGVVEVDVERVGRGEPVAAGEDDIEGDVGRVIDDGDDRRLGQREGVELGGAAGAVDDRDRAVGGIACARTRLLEFFERTRSGVEEKDGAIGRKGRGGRGAAAARLVGEEGGPGGLGFFIDE
ncbi:hypothetical protein [Tepidiforma sp.]|uniref:hypothetical protein n=1 Tax=Tepidiforma sp. TaxID=2682230 RepID=UPI00258C502E|nr:hypothetical protein [Tepidiforma sp.]